MRYFKKVFSIVIVIGAAVGIWFYLENMDPVVVQQAGDPALWCCLARDAEAGRA